MLFFDYFYRFSFNGYHENKPTTLYIRQQRLLSCDTFLINGIQLLFLGRKQELSNHVLHERNH